MGLQPLPPGIAFVSTRDGPWVERYEAEAGATGDQGHTARLISTYVPDTRVVAQLGGTTQPLPGGRSLVAYGNGGRVEAYDAAGQVVWRIEGKTCPNFQRQAGSTTATPCSEHSATVRFAAHCWPGTIRPRTG